MEPNGTYIDSHRCRPHSTGVSMYTSSILSVIWVEYSKLQSAPGSPSQLGCRLLWNTALRSASVSICPYSSQLPVPLPSSVPVAGIASGCSGRNGVPACGPPSTLRCPTTTICGHHSGRKILCELQWMHGRTGVCRTW